MSKSEKSSKKLLKRDCFNKNILNRLLRLTFKTKNFQVY